MSDLRIALNFLKDKISKGELICLEQTINKEIEEAKREAVREYDKQIMRVVNTKESFVDNRKQALKKWGIE